MKLMEVTASKSHLDGIIQVPPSKSHTIRAVLIAALAEGRSVVQAPLESLDTRSALRCLEAFGARVEFSGNDWIIDGVGEKIGIPDNVVDVGNSGTTLYMLMGTAALVQGWTVLTGDDQIRRRTASPLITALRPLGADVFSTRGNGMAPIVVHGSMHGGSTSVAGISSQYLSSLLLACPLAAGDTEIIVTVLNERPYVRMTLDWLESQGIRVETDDTYSVFRISGNQRYRPFERKIPGDYSSAAFPLCAGVLAGGSVELKGLLKEDSQGDKEVISILRRMGASIEATANSIIARGGGLRGIDIDMNAIPDAIPIMAVCACFAEGTTVLHNVPQARIKETDRIAVMARELTRLGADIRELPDGMIIKGTGLRGGTVHGHGDHRIVMAMAVAGLAADAPITVDTAETADVTFPGFWNAMTSMGAHFRRNT